MQYRVQTDRPCVGAYWGTRKLSNNNPQFWLGRASPLSLDRKRLKVICFYFCSGQTDFSNRFCRVGSRFHLGCPKSMGSLSPGPFPRSFQIRPISLKSIKSIKALSSYPCTLMPSWWGFTGLGRLQAASSACSCPASLCSRSQQYIPVK